MSLGNGSTSSACALIVRPCAEEQSSPEEFFQFSRCCYYGNCSTSSFIDLPGATIISPVTLFLTGISGQIIALHFLHRKSRHSSLRKRRTMFYFLLTSLIWKDLMGKIATTTLPLLAYIRGSWVGGALTCAIHGYTMSVVAMFTHQLMALMALERYLGLGHSLIYSQLITFQKTRLVLISISAFALLFCGLPLLGFGEFRLHYPGTWCYINQHNCWDHLLSSQVFGYLYTTINLLCLLVIVYFNLLVAGFLLKRRCQPLSDTIRTNQRFSSAGFKNGELQMAILLLIIVVIFLISWLPHDFLMIINSLWPTLPDEIPYRDLNAIRLVALNQISEPYLYIICRMVFRSKYFRMLSCRLFETVEFGGSSKGVPGSILQDPFVLARSSRRDNRKGRSSSLPNQNRISKRTTEGSIGFIGCHPLAKRNSWCSLSEKGFRKPFKRKTSF